MDLGKFRDEADRSIGYVFPFRCEAGRRNDTAQVVTCETRLIGSPSQSEMRLLLQAFLTRLCVLEGQLMMLDPEGEYDGSSTSRT